MDAHIFIFPLSKFLRFVKTFSPFVKLSIPFFTYSNNIFPSSVNVAPFFVLMNKVTPNWFSRFFKCHVTAGCEINNFSAVVWSCASKYVKEEIEPSAIAQVGVKIPVHIMTKQGWDIVSNHLKYMGFYDDVNLQQGNEKPVLLNSQEGIKVLKKERLRKCNDCPHPCI